MIKSKKELEDLKAKYEEKIKRINSQIEKIKTPIGFNYTNRKL